MDGFDQYCFCAPGNIFKKGWFKTTQTDQVITAVCCRPQDKIIPAKGLEGMGQMTDFELWAV